MKRLPLLLAIIGLAFTVPIDKQAFQWFDVKGNSTSFEKILKEILKEKPDIIFFGEQHNNSICHWWELELTKSIYSVNKDKLALGAEMFESDNQIIIDEYLQGKMNAKTFADEAKIWPNFKTDYKPLLDLAKDNKLPFIATNVPSRYAKMVYNNGITTLDSIDADSKKWIAALPIRYNEYLKCYKDIFKMTEGHNNPNLPKSQAIKDATMANFILKNWTKGKMFIHYNGAYHSDNNEGIVWYLKQENPELKIIVISSVEQENISKLEKESIGVANYVLCIPASMTKTY